MLFIWIGALKFIKPAIRPGILVSEKWFAVGGAMPGLHGYQVTPLNFLRNPSMPVGDK